MSSVALQPEERLLRSVGSQKVWISEGVDLRRGGSRKGWLSEGLDVGPHKVILPKVRLGESQKGILPKINSGGLPESHTT